MKRYQYIPYIFRGFIANPTAGDIDKCPKGYLKDICRYSRKMTSTTYIINWICLNPYKNKYTCCHQKTHWDFGPAISLEKIQKIILYSSRKKISFFGYNFLDWFPLVIPKESSCNYDIPNDNCKHFTSTNFKCRKGNDEK